VNAFGRPGPFGVDEGVGGIGGATARAGRTPARQWGVGRPPVAAGQGVPGVRRNPNTGDFAFPAGRRSRVATEAGDWAAHYRGAPRHAGGHGRSLGAAPNCDHTTDCLPGIHSSATFGARVLGVISGRHEDRAEEKNAKIDGADTAQMSRSWGLWRRPRGAATRLCTRPGPGPDHPGRQRCLAGRDLPGPRADGVEAFPTHLTYSNEGSRAATSPPGKSPRRSRTGDRSGRPFFLFQSACG